MAKGTKAQEVSTGTPDSYTPEELADPTPPLRINRPMLGVVPEEVKPSVGMHSSPSSKKETSNGDNENPSLQPPVLTTENPSGQMEKGDSDAALMGGVGQTPTALLPSDEEDDEEDDESEDEDSEETPEPVTKKATPAKKAASKKARVRSTDADFDF